MLEKSDRCWYEYKSSVACWTAGTRPAEGGQLTLGNLKCGAECSFPEIPVLTRLSDSLADRCIDSEVLSVESVFRGKTWNCEYTS